MNDVLQKSLTRHRAYARRVDIMLGAAEELCGSVTDLLSDVNACVKPSVREDTNTQDYDGFETFMAPCLIMEWELHGWKDRNTSVQMVVRLTTSFDDMYQETVVLAHNATKAGSNTLSVHIELCPDCDEQEVRDVIDAACARVVESRDRYVALSNAD